MLLNFGNYEFDEPYSSTNELQNKSGVYVILYLSGDQLQPVDLVSRLPCNQRAADHDRAGWWERSCSGTFMVAGYYTLTIW